jgi:hypothetical protein
MGRRGRTSTDAASDVDCRSRVGDSEGSEELSDPLVRLERLLDLRDEQRPRVERVLVLVAAEVLPPQSDHVFVVGRDKVEDDASDEVRDCNVAPEPVAAHGLDREHREVVARGRVDVEEVVGDVDGEEGSAGDGSDGEEPAPLVSSS